MKPSESRQDPHMFPQAPTDLKAQAAAPAVSAFLKWNRVKSASLLEWQGTPRPDPRHLPRVPGWPAFFSQRPEPSTFTPTEWQQSGTVG